MVGTKKNVLDFNPRLPSDYILYSRLEPNGSLTIRTANKNSNDIVNRTYFEIISMCNGQYTIQDIINSLVKKYESAPKKLIKDDVISTINELTQKQALVNRENPFLAEVKIKMKNNKYIHYCNYNQINEVKTVLNDSNVEPYIVYNNPYQEGLLIQGLINGRLISNDFQHYLFYGSDGVQSNSLLLWSSRDNLVFSLESIKILDAELNIEKFIINSILSIGGMLKNKKLIFRYYSQNLEKDNLLTELIKIGFEQTAILKREVKSGDLIEYSYYLDKL